MSIRIGIYDFFAHVIPGGVLLAAILFGLRHVAPLPIDIADASTLQFLALGTVAYILGYAIDPLSKRWEKLFRPKDLYQRTVASFQAQNPKVAVQTESLDLFTLLYFIKRHSIEMSQDLDQLKAVSIMLRNTSFGLLIVALVFWVEGLLTNQRVFFGMVGVLCLGLAIALIRESIKFETWFIKAIHQSVVALIAEPHQLSVTLKPDPRQTSDPSQPPGQP